MNIEQYLTSETDKLYSGDICVEYEHAAALERRLAACREALTRIVNENLTLDQVERIAEEALSQTKP